MKSTSKYGSLTASGHDIGTTDRMEEKGLVANLLNLAEAHHAEDDGTRRTLSIVAWPGYVLHNFAATAEVVIEALAADAFVLLAPDLPDGTEMALHLAVSGTRYPCKCVSNGA